MNFKEIQEQLQNKTQAKVPLTEIGNALGIKLSTVSTRIKKNSELKYNEIKKIEDYFSIKLIEENKNANTFPKYKNEKIQNMIKTLGIGFTAYGVYCALVELTLYNGITVGDEKRISHELSTEENIIVSILNNFGLFFIHNNFYKSVLNNNEQNYENFYILKLENFKQELITEIKQIIQK